MQDILITFAASYLIWIMFFGLGILWLIDGKIKKEQVIHALIASFLAWLLAEFVKQIFHTPRPFQLNGLPPLTLTVPTDPAFPSGHEALAFGLAVTVWLHDKKVGILFVALAVLVGIARILADVHYPLDIVGGAIMGAFIAFLIERFHFFVSKRK